MWGKNKPAKIVTDMSSWASCISAGTSVNGSINFEKALLVEGIVTGDIKGPTIKVAQGAHVVGNIEADAVIVEGMVSGDIKGKSVHFSKSAVLNGSNRVEYEVLQVEPGSVVAGTFVQNLVKQEKAVKAQQSTEVALAT